MHDDDETQHRIRHHAYLLWLEEGQPEGRCDEHWRAACEAVATEVPPAEDVPHAKAPTDADAARKIG